MKLEKTRSGKMYKLSWVDYRSSRGRGCGPATTYYYASSVVSLAKQYGYTTQDITSNENFACLVADFGGQYSKIVYK